MKVSKQHILGEARNILAECREMVPGLSSALKHVHFRVSSRMTRSAGKVRPASGEITLSLPYFENADNFKKEFRNTVTHEIAHILSPPTRDPWTRRRSSHGPAWQAMHRRLGGTGERCHELELAEGYERKRAPRTKVPCPKCGQPVLLGPMQLKRYRMGALYSHQRCPR